MSRPSKISHTLRDGSGATNGQLSLFTAGRSDEVPEMAVIPDPVEAKAVPVQRTKKHTAYSAADIQVLEGAAAIRHRPGMYIGSTSTSGLLHLIWEALDNAVDEAVAGFGQQIWISIDAEGWVTVRDEARGMPFDSMLYQGDYLPAATVILTVPHSGGKFAEGVYKTAGGLHGVGATVINALSEWVELDIWRDGQHFSQRFERGKAHTPRMEPAPRSKRGTQLRWRFDSQIFDHDAYYPR